MTKTPRGMLLLAVLSSSMALANEHLVELRREQLRDYSAELAVRAGKFKEVCVPLKSGDRIAWRFSSSSDTAFNVHFHVGRDVSYPEKRESVRAADGVLRVDRDEHYCWMWKPHSGEAIVKLGLTDSRR